MKETLKDLYRTKVWSEIGEEVKIKLLNGLRNNLVACHLKVCYIAIIIFVMSFFITGTH